MPHLIHVMLWCAWVNIFKTVYSVLKRKGIFLHIFLVNIFLLHNGLGFFNFFSEAHKGKKNHPMSITTTSFPDEP